MGLRSLSKVGTRSPNTENSSVNLGKTGNQSWKRPGERNSYVRYLLCSRYVHTYYFTLASCQLYEVEAIAMYNNTS